MRFSFTAPNIKGSIVSTPGTPAGASQMSTCFSSSVCGAWSDAMMSMVPSLSAFQRCCMHRFLSGGFIFPNVPRRSQSRCSRKRWCGATSHVKGALFLPYFIRLTTPTPSLVLRWQMCVRAICAVCAVCAVRAATVGAAAASCISSTCSIAIASQMFGRAREYTSGRRILRNSSVKWLHNSPFSAWIHAIAPSRDIAASSGSSSASPTASSPSAMNSSPNAVTPRFHNSVRSAAGVAPPFIPKSIIDFRSADFSLSLNDDPSSVGGTVFGWSIAVVTPPAAAAHEPVYQSSLCVSPGSRKWTWESITPGSASSPRASIVSASPEIVLPIFSIFPSDIAISMS